MKIEDLLDQFEEYIYITDIETKELLYVNKAEQKRFHTAKWQGMKCYELLMNRDTPCSFCTCPQIKEKKIMDWEIFNPIVRCQATVKDIYLRYQGRDAKLQIAKDIDEELLRNRRLESALEMEKVSNDCLQKLYKSSDPRDTVAYTLTQIGRLLQSDRAFVFKIEDGVMNNTYEWCEEGVKSQQEFCQNMDISLMDIWADTFRQKRRCDIPDVELLKDSYPESYEVLRVQGIHAISASPLLVNGEIRGYVGVDNPDCEEEYLNMLDTLSTFMGISMEHIELNENLRYISYHDSLTGLYNRNKYIEDVEQMEQDGHGELAVIYVDINGLKTLNDQFGHQYGDEILIESADILRRIFSEEKYVIYRVGGDEFAIFAHGITREKLKESMEKLEREYLLSVHCKGAVGYTYVEPEDNLHDSIVKADEQMYHDKKMYYRRNPQGGRYRSYTDTALKLRNQNVLMKELKKGRFEVYIQPKVDTKGSALIGAEALIRYRDEAGTLIPPDQFIPAMEETRTICYIDFYVLREICRFFCKWKKEGRELYPISVNFSRYTLMMTDFIDILESIWQEYQVPKQLIEIEVLERVELAEPEILVGIIQKIKEAGYQVSIDDFGVKYANLTLFTNADIDVLKSDRSLMNNILNNRKTQLLILALANLCHDLGIMFIIEGVETAEQFEMLRELGCDGVQGYYIDKPMPIADYEKKYLKTP